MCWSAPVSTAFFFIQMATASYLWIRNKYVRDRSQAVMLLVFGYANAASLRVRDMAIWGPLTLVGVAV